MLAALQHMIAQVQANGPSVLQVRHAQRRGTTGGLSLYEQYTDDAALAAHGTTAHMKALGAALAGISAGRMKITRLNYIDGMKR